MHPGQTHNKGAASAFAGALSRSFAAVAANNRAHDEQSEPSPLHLVRGTVRHTIKTLEDALQLRTCNADSIVLNAEHRSVEIRSGKLDGNIPFGPGVLD